MTGFDGAFMNALLSKDRSSILPESKSSKLLIIVWVNIYDFLGAYGPTPTIRLGVVKDRDVYLHGAGPAPLSVEPDVAPD